MYQIASEIPQFGFYGVRMAFADNHIEQQNLNQFGELVAINRSIFGKIFNGMAGVDRWLLAEEA